MDLRGTYKGGGGPDKTLLNSAALHDKSRVNVLVTYLRSPGDKEFNIDIRAKELRLNYTDIYDRSFIDFKCLLKLRKAVKENGISLVHAHDDKTLLYGRLLKLLIPGLKIMYTCHSHSCYKRSDFKSKNGYFRYFLRERVQIFLMKQYNKPVITVSEDTKRRLVGNGLPSHCIEVLYNGIDTLFWNKDKGDPVLRNELGVPDRGYLIGTVARITYDKDLPTFYKVAKKVSLEMPNVVFVIVGGGYGDELELARKEVERLGLKDTVKFTGHRSDLHNIYASLDVFLMTSITEGLPNTTLEAMAMSVPVVSTSIGGVPELVIHGKTGFLSEIRDSEGLSRQIIELLKNHNLRNEFALAGRKRVEESFDFYSRVKKMEDYYEKFGRKEI